MGFGPESEMPADRFLEELRNYPYELVLSLDSPECIKDGSDWEIGSKARRLAEMRQAQLPVPPGFVVRAGVGRKYQGLSIVEFHQDKILAKEIDRQLVLMRAESLKFFNGSVPVDGYWSDERPQLVSVRSGSKFSMPGMMGTILNVGINDERMPTLEKLLGKGCAWDCYRNFGYTYLETMFDVNVKELREGYERELAKKKLSDTVEREVEYLSWWHRGRTNVRDKGHEGFDLSMTKEEALFFSIWAVFHSWEARRARVNRRSLGIPDEAWTAVTVMPMIYGNLNEQSGSGVMYTYDPTTGKPEVKCSYAQGQQGIKVVGGALDPREMDSLPEEIREKLYEYGRQLTNLFGCGQDVEFTVQNGQLVLLQTRDQHLGPLPQVTMIGDLLQTEKITQEAVLEKVPQALLSRLGTRIKPDALITAEIWGRGDGVGGGASLGRIALSYEQAMVYTQQGDKAVLVVEQIDPHQPLENIAGVITVRGDSTSHGGNVVNAQGIPGVIGCRELSLNEGGKVFFVKRKLEEGDWIAVDGTEGMVVGGLRREDLETIELPDQLLFIPRMREKLLGGESLFTDAAVALGLGERARETTERVRGVFEGAQQAWKSRKAIAQELINKIIPGDLCIPYIICNSGDVSMIRGVVEAGWEEGWDVAVRSAYDPPQLAKNPWRYLPKGQTDHLNGFLDREGGDTSLVTWFDNGGLSEVLVGWLPVGTLDPTVGREHFVWTMFGSKKHGIVTRVIPHTPQLRAFEGVDAEHRFEGRAKMVKGLSGGVGNMRWIFPPTYYLDREIQAVTDAALWQGVWGNLVMAAFEQLHEVPGVVFRDEGKHDKRVLMDTVMTMARGGLLTPEEEDLLIRPEFLAVARHIQSQVFGKRWGEIAVAMAALENVLGPLTLEGQGRIDSNDHSLNWLKIYGIKGIEEKVLKLNGSI